MNLANFVMIMIVKYARGKAHCMQKSFMVSIKDPKRINCVMSVDSVSISNKFVGFVCSFAQLYHSRPQLLLN